MPSRGFQRYDVAGWNRAREDQCERKQREEQRPGKNARPRRFGNEVRISRRLREIKFK